MTEKMKIAFDLIQAEESLKKNTLSFLREKAQKRNNSRFLIPARRFAIAFASLAFIMMGVFSYALYFTESAYVDLDVNPSIELSVNRFDRVIGAYAYNPDGEAILGGLGIKHKNYVDAVGIVIDEMLLQGFISGDGLVSVTLQTNDKAKENLMLSSIESAVLNHHNAAQLDAFSVDDATRTAAHDVNLSPAKYIAILELQKVDPTATVESCREHTIGELKTLTREHSGNHHGTPAQPGSEDINSGHGGAENSGHGNISQGHQSDEKEIDDESADGTSNTGANGHNASGSNQAGGNQAAPNTVPSKHEEKGGHGHGGGHG